MRLAVAMLVLMGLVACGGGEEPTPEPTEEASAQSGPTLPSGTPVPEALSNFVCTAGKKDLWKASGVVANAGKNAADFQVTVYVGEAGNGTGEATTLQLPQIGGGESTTWKLDELPAAKGGGTCHVQVLQLK